MEALAGVASVVQLVEATAKAAKAVSTLSRNIHDTPTELVDLINHLDRIHKLLQQLGSFETNSMIPSSSITLSSLGELLNHTETTIFNIRKRYVKYKGILGIGRRLRLAVLESTAIQRYSNRIQALETELVLQLLCSQKLGEGFSPLTIRSDVDTVSKRSQIAKNPIRNVGDMTKTTCTWSYFAGRYIQALGLQFTVVQTQCLKEKDFSVQIKSSIPFVRSALQLQCHLAFHLSHSISFFGSWGVSRIISDDSDYLEACRRGDISSVREMIRRGTARPDDTTDENMTPLLYAAESGNAELVKLLIENGARVNWTGGHRQTTPLQWAIQHNHADVVRILIENDANSEHVSMLGWSAIFYCWPRMRRTGKEQSEVLKILAEYSVLDFNQTDTLEWTAFQRASAFGTSTDIETLIALGAKPLERRLPLQWAAIHYAIDAGNLSTFSALQPWYNDFIKDAVDERGWSLLHLAASKGNGQIIRHLLQGGANPILESMPSRLYLPEALFDRRCTPEDVAEAFGQEQHKVFLSIAQELGIELDRDVYWDAESR